MRPEGVILSRTQAGYDDRRRRDARSSQMRGLATICQVRGDTENAIAWPRAGRFIYAILFASRNQRIRSKSGRDRCQAAHTSFSRPPLRRSTADELRSRGTTRRTSHVSPRRSTVARCPVNAWHDSGRKPLGMTEDGRRKTEIVGGTSVLDITSFCAATDATDGQWLM